MAMYEGYIFAYFPVIFIVLFYSFCVKKQKTSAAVLIVALFVVLVTFIYFLFLFRLYRDARLPIPDRQQLRNALSQKTNLELSEVFDHYYYSSYSAAYDDRLLPEEIIAIRQSSLLKSLPSAIVCVCVKHALGSIIQTCCSTKSSLSICILPVVSNR